MIIILNAWSTMFKIYQLSLDTVMEETLSRIFYLGSRFYYKLYAGSENSTENLVGGGRLRLKKKRRKKGRSLAFVVVLTRICFAEH